MGIWVFYSVTETLSAMFLLKNKICLCQLLMPLLKKKNYLSLSKRRECQFVEKAFVKIPIFRFLFLFF